MLIALRRRDEKSSKTHTHIHTHTRSGRSLRNWTYGKCHTKFSRATHAAPRYISTRAEQLIMCLCDAGREGRRWKDSIYRDSVVYVCMYSPIFYISISAAETDVDVRFFRPHRRACATTTTHVPDAYRIGKACFVYKIKITYVSFQ